MKRPLLISMGAALLISCQDPNVFDDTLKTVAEQRAVVEAMQTLDLRSEEQYSALSTYFRATSDFASELKTDSKLQKFWSAQVKKGKLQDFCAKYLVTISSWQRLLSQCVADGRFLCPDEVRDLPENLEAILKSSPPALTDIVREDPRCAGWM